MRTLSTGSDQNPNDPEPFETRFDLPAIPAYLLALVPDSGYWKTMSFLFHGECTRQTFDDS
jgi:hypothetical protein